VKRKKKRKNALLIAAGSVVLVGIAVIVSIVALRYAKKAAYPLTHVDAVKTAAKKYDLPVSLIMGVIHTESRFQATAVSPDGAIGLMQIMPDTGSWIADKLNMKNYDTSKLNDPAVNIEMGCWYLQYLMESFEGDMKAVLAGYNAGQNRVRGWLKDSSLVDANGKLVEIPIQEAKDYVDKVLYAQKTYQDLYDLP